MILAVLVVLLGTILAAAAWLLTQRTHGLSPTGGGITVNVPRDWETTTPVAFPGGNDPQAGVRSSSGPRSVTVAFTSGYQAPVQVAARVATGTCGKPEASTVHVGPWDGVSWHFPDCAAGTVLDEVVFAEEGTNGWVAWVEVRSQAGEPRLADVLSSLHIAS